VGQRYNPIAYPLREIGLYTLLAAVLTALIMLVPGQNVWVSTTVRTLILLLMLFLLLLKFLLILLRLLPLLLLLLLKRLSTVQNIEGVLVFHPDMGEGLHRRDDILDIKERHCFLKPLLVKAVQLLCELLSL